MFFDAFLRASNKSLSIVLYASLISSFVTFRLSIVTWSNFCVYCFRAESLFFLTFFKISDTLSKTLSTSSSDLLTVCDKSISLYLKISI